MVNPVTAASKLSEHVLTRVPNEDVWNEDGSKNYASRGHIAYMIIKILSGGVEGEKAHRWLGYIQGVLVARGFASLDEMKEVNKSS